MLAKIAIVIAVVMALLIVALLAYAATRPDEFSVERSITIQAPPQKIEPFIVDFHRWTAWSPWERIDPTMQRTYAGAASGPGAVYEWTGEGKAGAGRMEITNHAPAAKTEIRIDFFKPMKARNTVEFTLQPVGAATRVTWRMHGPAPFISKLIQVFVSMDTLVGKDFAAGLAQLKQAAEKS